MTMNVRTLCLGILSLHEATGYEIRKMVEEGAFSHFIDASYGSIYPALAQLLKEGLVSVRTETAETGRPPRKVYTITEHGRAALEQALATDPARDKFKSEFLFQMLFMERIDAAQLTLSYDAYIAEQEAELERIRGAEGELPADHPGAEFVRAYGETVLSTIIGFLKSRREEMMEAFARHGKSRETAMAADGSRQKGEGGK